MVLNFVGVTAPNEVIASCGHIWRGHAQTHSLTHSFMNVLKTLHVREEEEKNDDNLTSLFTRLIGFWRGWRIKQTGFN